MGSAQAIRRINAPANVVWSFISWRGMAQLVGDGLFAGVDFETDEVAVGAIKRIIFHSGAPMRERLEWLDEGGLAYCYRVLDSGSYPVASYEAVVRVTAMGDGECAVVIRSDFIAIGISDAEFAANWIEMEDGLLTEIAKRSEASPRFSTEGVTG
jgi:hypothetical protein